MPELEAYKGFFLWDYVPSLPAAIVFLGLFSVATIWHAALLIRTRLWFCLPFIFGGLLEVGGYSARCVSHFNTGKLMPYIIQSTFILIPPVLFAASIYMVLSRIIRQAKGEDYSVVPVRWLTKIFVAGDIVAFFVQAGGAGLMASDDNMKLGQDIVIGGLAIQIVMFSLFVVTAAIFHVRYNKYSVSAVTVDAGDWLPTLYMLYAVSALILVRSVFRVVEFVMGRDGYLLQHEWTLYTFDSALMWAVMVLFAIWWPRKVQLQKLG